MHDIIYIAGTSPSQGRRAAAPLPTSTSQQPLSLFCRANLIVYLTTIRLSIRCQPARRGCLLLEQPFLLSVLHGELLLREHELPDLRLVRALVLFQPRICPSLLQFAFFCKRMPLKIVATLQAVYRCGSFSDSFQVIPPIMSIRYKDLVTLFCCTSAMFLIVRAAGKGA